MSIHTHIRYDFTFSNGDKKEITLRFDESTLDLIADNDVTPDYWADLTYHQCNDCPLDTAFHRHCPSAVHIGWILKELEGYNSFEEVHIEVSDDTRRYSKVTSLQDGLGALIGIIMPTSGCPLLKPLRPMVRFHLPFVTLEEMEYRMVSMYLFAQYLRMQNGQHPDFTLDGLQEIYKKVREVNKSFINRIPTAANSDTGINAVVILDCFAQSVPKAIQKMMKEFNHVFAPLL